MYLRNTIQIVLVTQENKMNTSLKNVNNLNLFILDHYILYFIYLDHLVFVRYKVNMY